MGNKEKFLGLVSAKDDQWIAGFEADIANEEAFDANMRIVLKIIDFMKREGLKQKELAARLEVSPQYINKLLRGKENIKVETAILYGRKLGIELIAIPSENEFPIQEQVYSAIKSCFVSFGTMTESTVSSSSYTPISSSDYLKYNQHEPACA